MDSRKFVIKQTLLILMGQAVCVAAMLGIFALLGKFDQKALLGGIFGGLIATLNFFFMAIAATIASDKAVNQDVKGGEATVRISYIARMVVMAVVLFALVKSGLCNVFALVLPLVFTRPVLTLIEFFRKGDDNA
jgi:F0F1-type ATP synthase assembly protein I